MTTDRQIKLRQALATVGVTPEQQQERAEWLYDHTLAPDGLSLACALYEALDASIQEAWPPRQPVTRDTPLGTRIAFEELPPDQPLAWLVGWDNGLPVVKAFYRDGPQYFRGFPDKWYVVEDES